jgi:hypothetical protein
VIRKIGIKPDVAVAANGDGLPLSPREERLMSPMVFLERNDAQLIRAIELLGYTPLAVKVAPAA